MTDTRTLSNRKAVKDFIESFNNATFKDRFKRDGKIYVSFESTIFAKNGICRELGLAASLEPMSGRWEICLG